MPKGKANNNPKNKYKKELENITDTVDLESLNRRIDNDNVISLDVSKKTLLNISKWFLDGKSEFEVRQNLELDEYEWQYLLKVCPTILVIMQHSTAYADMVVGATLLQTAIGGKIIKKKVPLKVRDYIDGKVVGEHYEMVEIEEETPANPYLLKYLAEHKLSEKLGNNSSDLSKEHRDYIDAMSPEEIEAIRQLNSKKKEEDK